jgi:DNA-binding response OmpR family regulator
MVRETDGLEVCRPIREKEKDGDHHTYIIMRTAAGDRNDIVEKAVSSGSTTL